MRKIFFILFMFFGVAYGQRYQNMPQPGYGPINRLLVNGILTIPRTSSQQSNITDGIDTGRIRYNESDSSLQVYTGFQWRSSGATPTWQQTLTAGSTLTGNNTIAGGGFDFTWNNIGAYAINSSNDFTVTNTATANTQMSFGDSGFSVDVYTGSHSSRIQIYPDTIILKPLLGLLHIDTLANLSTQDELLGRRNSTGQVGRITVGSGLSLSGGALSATGTTPISSLTAAAASNSISNANYTQQWAWGLTGGSVGLSLVNTTTTSIGNEKTLEVFTNGTHASNNITTFGQKVSNSHIGTGSINIALQAQAANGDENIAFWANRGKARFGTNGTEKGVLEILGNTSGTITIQPQPTAGTYNLNLPTTAGTSGYLLTSAGGGASPMTWTDPATLTTPLSKLTAAVATNSINNDNYAQTWAWNSKTSGNALSLGINGTAALSGQTVLDIKSQGANSGSAKVTYGLQITNSKTGTTSVNYAANFIASGGEQTHGALITSSGSNTANGISAFAQGIGANVGGRFGATGGTSNYAILVAPSEGSVGIGTLTPDSTLHVFGGFKYVNGSQGSGKYLTSDANGGATWGTISTGLTVGTTAIASGTDTKVLYNNSGVVGEYTVSGSGNVAMTTSPVLTTPDLGTPSALVGTNITGTAASLTAGNATTLATSRNLNGAAFNGSADVLVPEINPSVMALLGSTILAEPVAGDVYKTASSSNLTDGQVRYVAVYIPRSMTITGVKFMQQTQGSYTADNYNGVGLYSYSGGNLTLVASSTDDGNIWKATSFTWSSKAFSATYSASAGLYFVALLYNSSAQVTAPALRANQLSSDLLNTVDFTNTAKVGASLTGQTALPAGPTAMSTLATNSSIPYLALY